MLHNILLLQLFIKNHISCPTFILEELHILQYSCYSELSPNKIGLSHGVHFNPPTSLPHQWSDHIWIISWTNKVIIFLLLFFLALNTSFKYLYFTILLTAASHIAAVCNCIFATIYDCVVAIAIINKKAVIRVENNAETIVHFVYFSLKRIYLGVPCMRFLLEFIFFYLFYHQFFVIWLLV